MFVEILLQHEVHVRFLPERAPQQEPDRDQADGQDLPPGPLVLDPHGAVHPPGPVAALAGGELDGFIVHLVRLRGHARLWSQSRGSHFRQPSAWHEAGCYTVGMNTS